jgi:hypothetical protein
MRILNLFYLNIKENSPKNLSEEEISEFENYLFKYIELTSKDLLSNEIQSSENVNLQGDEDMKIIAEKNCNIYFNRIVYDSEAFLFTTKKIIENSKKLNQRLKELDN